MRTMLTFGEYVGESNEPRNGMKTRWSLGRKRRINCSNPRGFSEKQYCRRKARGGKYKS